MRTKEELKIYARKYHLINREKINSRAREYNKQNKKKNKIFKTFECFRCGNTFPSVIRGHFCYSCLMKKAKEKLDKLKNERR